MRSTSAFDPLTPAMREATYERQEGICPICGNYFAIKEMESDTE